MGGTYPSKNDWKTEIWDYDKNDQKLFFIQSKTTMKFDLFSKSMPAMPATGEGTKIIDHFRIYNLTAHAFDYWTIYFFYNSAVFSKCSGK